MFCQCTKTDTPLSTEESNQIKSKRQSTHVLKENIVMPRKTKISISKRFSVTGEQVDCKIEKPLLAQYPRCTENVLFSGDFFLLLKIFFSFSISNKTAFVL